MLSLKDRVAFMPGAGSVGDNPDAKVWGSGKATAVRLARQGARIYGVDLRKEAADVTKAIIEKEGAICLTRRVDMTKASKVQGRSGRLREGVWPLLSRPSASDPLSATQPSFCGARERL